MASTHRPSSPLWLLARQELVLAIRSRWIQTFAAVFAILALVVATSGYVLSGGNGFQDFARTSASLVELVLFLVPLASLVFGVVALASDPGAAELLFSQPVGRRTILLGRGLGLFAALVSAEAVGFGASGIVMFLQTDATGLASFFGVVAGAVLLTAVFLSLAALVAGGDTSRRRTRHLATVLIIWFVAVMLFDIMVLGLASMLPSAVASRLLVVSAIANPVDAVRTGTLLAVEGTAAFGSASLAFLRLTGSSLGAALWLLASVVIWIVGPLLVASHRTARADI